VFSFLRLITVETKWGVMVVILVLGALAAIAVYFFGNTYRNLSRNVALAKSSGLPVVVMPWNAFSILSLSTFALWLPLLKKFLPTSLQGLWVEYASFSSTCRCNRPNHVFPVF
jgi:hypothetical protein